MKEDFDFNKVGKRMPYTVPDRFFTDFEDGVWKELGKREKARTPKKHRLLLQIVASAISVAAVLALFFAIHDGGTVSLPEVEQAFDRLSAEDQAYLFAVYDDDILINQFTNE